MKRLVLMTLVALFLFTTTAFGAACTNGWMSRVGKMNNSNQLVYQLYLVSKSDGTISGGSNCKFPLDGHYIHKVSVFPAAATDNPTALYDCRFNDALGNDLMEGNLQNLPTSNSIGVGIYTPTIGGSTGATSAYGSVDVVCAAMGSGKITTFDVYLYKDDN